MNQVSRANSRQKWKYRWKKVGLVYTRRLGNVIWYLQRAKVKNAITLTTTACILLFRAIDELQREGLHYSRATVFTWNGQWANNLCKQRADVFIASRRRFDRAWSMVGIFHTNWQNEVNVTELTLRSFQVSQKNLGSCACANSVYQTLSLIFQVPGNEARMMATKCFFPHYWNTLCVSIMREEKIRAHI